MPTKSPRSKKRSGNSNPADGIGNGTTIIPPQPRASEDASLNGPIGVLNRKGAKSSFTCSVINVPNGTAVDNRGQFDADHVAINGTSPPCTPSEEKIGAIDFLLKVRSAPGWDGLVVKVLGDKFDQQAVEAFTSQPDYGKKIEFLKKLRESINP